jgi:putative acetyltransferase
LHHLDVWQKEMTVGTELKIAKEDPSQPEILMLLRDGEEYSAKLYPAERNHHMPLSALRASNVRFLVAGAWAELKRMWVVPEARRLGVSRIILTAHARSEGVRTLRLETGVENRAALDLYTRAGFSRCNPFADYRADPLSVFMRKDLSNNP